MRGERSEDSRLSIKVRILGVHMAGRISTSIVAAAFLFTGVMKSEASPQTERGRHLAQKWCASCHEIKPRRVERPGAPSQASDVAPSFRAISRRLSGDEISGKLFNPHTGMPTDALRDSDIMDITAYIKSLQ